MKIISCKHGNAGEKNGMWKGDDAGYYSLHEWLRRIIAKPEKCPSCGRKTKNIDICNISGEYKRDLSDWELLCRSCHMKKDGRMKRLHKKTIEKKTCLNCNKKFLPSQRKIKFCSRKCYMELRKYLGTREEYEKYTMSLV